jgi:ferredoxin
MPYITILPSGREVELPEESPLTDVEHETFGEKLIRFGCRLGVCGACAIEVVTGFDALGQPEPEEKLFLSKLGHDPDKVRLACQCRVFGNVSIKPALRTRSASGLSKTAIAVHGKSLHPLAHDC